MKTGKCVSIFALTVLCLFCVSPAVVAQSVDTASLVGTFLKQSTDLSSYPGFLRELEKQSPGSVDGKNFALGDFLARLKNAGPGEDDIVLKGSLPSAISLPAGHVLPSDTVIELDRRGNINAATRGDFSSGGLRVNGGRHNRVGLGVHETDGVFLCRLQTTQSAVVDGLPVRAEPMYESWDYTLELLSNGKPRRLVLSDAWKRDGIELGRQDKVQLDGQGRIERASIGTPRTVRGHDALPYAPFGTRLAFTGFSSSLAAPPNIYFQGGKLSWCFESGKVLAGRRIDETLAYGYASDEKTVVNVFTPTGVFLGYPVRIDGHGGWDGEPPRTITVEGDRARFPVDVDLTLAGTGHTVAVSRNSMIEIDLATGACVKVTTPGLPEVLLKVEDRFVPDVQGSEAERALKWASVWLSMPDSKNDGYRIMLHEAVARWASQEIEFGRQYDAILKAALAGGYVSREGDRYAIDLDGDAKTPAKKNVPLNASSLAVLQQLADAAGDFAPARQAGLVALFFASGSQSFRLGEISPVQRKIDLVGASLEKKGIHALEKWKSYYTPDSSGDKAVKVGFVEFGPNGTVKTLREMYDAGIKSGGTPLMTTRLPDGRDVLSRDAFWHEASGKLKSISIGDGSVDSELPNGDWMSGFFPGFFEDGRLNYFGGIWGGHEFKLPWGFESREVLAISFFKNGAVEHVYSGTWLRLPVTAGQKISIQDLRNKKPLTLTVDADKVIEGNLDCKVWFDATGKVREISLWSDAVLKALGMK